jgi:hypothetical protein
MMMMMIIFSGHVLPSWGTRVTTPCMLNVVIHVSEGSTLGRMDKRECEEHEKNRGPG